MKKCIFVGYFEDVKGHRLLQPKSKNIIIRRDVKFDENISACEASSAGVPSLACEPNSTYVPPLSISSIFDSIPSSSDDDSEDDNPPPPLEDVPSALQLPRWVCSTRDAAGFLASDPTNRRCTRSQFERASSLLAQVPENPNLDTFEEASGHPDWNEVMNE